MARSQFIYLLWDEHTADIIGAYTVKHEVLSAREKLLVAQPHREIVVYRFRDGLTNDMSNWTQVEP
jgi:hypothetical protein